MMPEPESGTSALVGSGTVPDNNIHHPDDVHVLIATYFRD
jgi:hypothetical protein